MPTDSVKGQRNPSPATDTELLDRLEAAILRGIVLWDGVGAFPAGVRAGLSLLGGRRPLRDAIRQYSYRDAYRKAAMKAHPDVCSDGGATWTKLQEAARILDQYFKGKMT